jgi:hypothetical protein
MEGGLEVDSESEDAESEATTEEEVEELEAEEGVDKKKELAAGEGGASGP